MAWAVRSVVAGDHHDLQAHARAWSAMAARAGRLGHVGHRDDARPPSRPRRRTSGSCRAAASSAQRAASGPAADAALGHEALVAQQHLPAVDARLDAPAGDGLEALQAQERPAPAPRRRARSPPPAGARSPSRRRRPAAAASSPVPCRPGHDVGDHRAALGDGAGLVQHDGLDAVGLLQGRAALDQDAVLRALAGADHDGRGGGQPQGAGAGDDEHRGEDGQAEHHALPADQPGRRPPQGDAA